MQWLYRLQKCCSCARLLHLGLSKTGEASWTKPKYYCVYIHFIYVYIYIYIHIHICMTCTLYYIHIHIETVINVYTIYIYICVYIYIYIHTWDNIYIYIISHSVPEYTYPHPTGGGFKSTNVLISMHICLIYLHSWWFQSPMSWRSTLLRHSSTVEKMRF